MAGKRRSEAEPENVRRVIKALARMLEKHHTGMEKLPLSRRITRKAFAERLGVSLRQIGRWIDGSHWPTAADLAAIEKDLVRCQEMIATGKGRK